MKRILIFSLAYYPCHVSGAEAAIKEVTNRIPREDIAFDMVTLRFDKKDPLVEMVGNVRVYRVVGGKILFPLLAAIGARRLHAKHRYDGIWAMMTYMAMPVVLARIFGVRVPYALTLQDGDPYSKVFGRLRIRLFLPLIDRGFRSATVIQSISKYLSTWPALRGSKAPIELIRNGANPKDLKESFGPAAVEAIKQKLHKQPGDIWLVNTSRLEHQKGQDTVIRALPMLPDTVKFLIVGGGSDEQMLKDLTKKLRLESRVMFAGQVTRDEVTAYRKASDIFVATSRSEGLGNAFVSALASRLPLITTGVGGIADYAVDQETAWIVPADNPKALAAKIKEVLANPQKAQEISARARAMVEREYDWDKIAKEMRERVFAKIV